MAAVANVAVNLDSRGVPAKLKQIADRSKEVDRSLNGAAAASTKAGREIKTAANGMRYFTDAAGRARKVNGQFVTSTEAAAAGIKKQGDAAQSATRGFDGLARKAAGLAAAYLGLNAAQSAVRQGIQRIESERRIQFLAQGYGEVAALQDAATKAAKRFGTGQTEANRALADVFARLRPVGVGLNDIVSIYNGFNTAARISGSTAVESANAFRQLSQALGSGALRGDEFNSISEQVPGILTAISKETGVAQGQLRKFAAEGGITADIVIRALKRIETEGAAQLEAALGGPAQAIADFQNAAEDVQVALTQDIVPQMAEVFRGLAELIVNLEGPIKFIGGVASDTLNQINSLITQATKPAAFAARRDIEAGLIPTNLAAAFTGGDVRGGAKELFGEAGLSELEERAREFSKLRGVGFQETLLQFMQDRLKTMDAAPTTASSLTLPTLTPPRLPTLGSGGGGGAGRTGRGPSAEDILKDQLAAGERIAKQLQREINLRNASNDLERELLGIKFNYEDVVANINANAAERQREELLNLAERNRLDQENLATIEARDKKLQEAFKMDFASLFKQDQSKLQEFIIDSQNSLKDLEQVAINVSQGVGSAISSSLVNGIQGLIEGSAKVKDVFANMLKSVGQVLAQEGAKMIATYIAIGIAKAFAGLSGGTKFGEMGNFDQAVPGASGFSTPSSFNASGLFGRANGGPVASGRPYMVGERGPELFMPQQSGSIRSNEDLRALMGRSPAGTAQAMNFTFETTNIGGTEYVSREQLEAAMATTRRQAANDGAKRGMNMTLDRMQNSPRTRARVGIS